ncbi:MAG: DNA circularization N-terminal domain-containing protein [Desulfovibrionaceae bacterium]|nr:DNA circularization N-terminal domain-containing protein [Desulfovibrionaceae bacterium]
MGTEMSWKERIRPASFRGAPFGVRGDDKAGGRRTVVHEFPQRDEVYVEDLGAASQRFTVQAFVLGQDYMDRRDALERALDEPGSGTLVHPWYGEITVSQFAPYRVRHSADDGGMAVFTLSFVRDGAPSSPDSGVNARDRALSRSGEAGILACDAFDSAFALANQGVFVLDQAYLAVTSAMSRAQAALGGNAGVIAGMLGAATGHDFLPWLSVGRRLWAGFQGLGDAAGGSPANRAAGWLNLAGQGVPRPLIEAPGSLRERVAENDLAVRLFIRQIATVEAAAGLALAEPASRAEARVLRESFVDVMDAVQAALEDRSGTQEDFFAALADMRAATLAALAEAARSAPDIVTYVPVAVLPSLALCYRISGDIAPEADLLARNRIIHPGFVPAEPLEALAYG